MPHRRTTLVILSLALGALMSACNSQPETPAADQKPAPPPAPTAEERVKWYQACWDNFNQKQWDNFKQCYAANAKSQQVGYGKADATGPDAIVASSQDFAKMSPDVHGDLQLILVNGNRIAAIALLKGTNSGPMAGPDGKEMPATNKKFGLFFGHAIETEANANKLTKEIGAQDSATFAAQLGMSKNPARPVMDKGEAMPKIVIAKNDETEMKNLEVEKLQMELWNKHDGPGVDMYMAGDLVFHDMTTPKDQNKKQAADGLKPLWKALSDVKLTADALWAAGDYVTIVGTFAGTNDGDFPEAGIKKTGKKVSLPYMEIDRMEGGKVKEAWLFFDSGSFMSQLGMK